jgi:DNA-binding PadR family transcriptional regulator
VRRFAEYLDASKTTVQARLSSLQHEGLVERLEIGGIRTSASYKITRKGRYALRKLKAADAATSLTAQGKGHTLSSEITGTWYRRAEVPDAMRSRSLRGPWELWSAAPHDHVLLVAEALELVSIKTPSSLRSWIDRLAELPIPLACWEDDERARFRLLDADPHVFDQLRQVQEHEAAQQGRRLRGRRDLRRSHAAERMLAELAIERLRNQS